VVRDIVIGMADGLTVPFALAAGLTGGRARGFSPNYAVTSILYFLLFDRRLWRSK